jgi:biotin carboxyl carrier protein
MPRRLPDGTVFVPKPSQRLLNVRTAITKPEPAQKAVSLIGRVIADPNRSGLVQSINGGRIVAPEGGLPRLGQAVKKGQVLALVEQAIPQADRTTISERAGEIEQEIASAETKLKRVRQLAERGVAPASQVQDAETELEGLRRRREIVRQTRIESEVLRAPIDGTIAAARVVAGQVVASQDVVFQIIDPKGLWVEALVYGEIDPAKVTGASAMAVDGTPLKLAFQASARRCSSRPRGAVRRREPAGQPVGRLAGHGLRAERGFRQGHHHAPGCGCAGSQRRGGGVAPHGSRALRGAARADGALRCDPARDPGRRGEGERIVVRGSELINQIR